MRITSLFSLNAIALDVAASNQDEIIDKVVELQSTHNNILDKEAYKKALYAREEEGSTYVDNGITVPHAKSDVVTRPSLAALRLSSPVQYNPDDDGKTDQHLRRRGLVPGGRQRPEDPEKIRRLRHVSGQAVPQGAGGRF